MDLLDLTGKADRKPAPQQFHHAYSIRFYRPKDSPLRKEVEGLWKQREEQSVITKLTPFMTTGSFNVHLDFHNAVMRWKCSLLTDEERQEHQDWINQNALEKEKEMKEPWRAMRGEDDDVDTTENEHIQRYASLPLL